MKLASFEIDGRRTYGMLVGDSIREISDTFRASYPDLRAALTAGQLQAIPESVNDKKIALDSIRYLPLIPNPDKLLSMTALGTSVNGATSMEDKVKVGKYIHMGDLLLPSLC